MNGGVEGAGGPGGNPDPTREPPTPDPTLEPRNPEPNLEPGNPGTRNRTHQITQTSNPTALMSASALLVLTTPGRIL